MQSNRLKAFLKTDEAKALNLTKQEVKMLELDELDEREISSTFLMWVIKNNFKWEGRFE